MLHSLHQSYDKKQQEEKKPIPTSQDNFSRNKDKKNNAWLHHPIDQPGEQLRFITENRKQIYLITKHALQLQQQKRNETKNKQTNNKRNKEQESWGWVKGVEEDAHTHTHTHTHTCTHTHTHMHTHTEEREKMKSPWHIGKNNLYPNSTHIMPEIKAM